MQLNLFERYITDSLIVKPETTDLLEIEHHYEQALLQAQETLKYIRSFKTLTNKTDKMETKPKVKDEDVLPPPAPKPVSPLKGVKRAGTNMAIVKELFANKNKLILREEMVEEYRKAKGGDTYSRNKADVELTNIFYLLKKEGWLMSVNDPTHGLKKYYGREELFENGIAKPDALPELMKPKRNASIWDKPTPVGEVKEAVVEDKKLTITAELKQSWEELKPDETYVERNPAKEEDTETEKSYNILSYLLPSDKYYNKMSGLTIHPILIREDRVYGKIYDDKGVFVTLDNVNIDCLLDYK